MRILWLHVLLSIRLDRTLSWSTTQLRTTRKNTSIQALATPPSPHSTGSCSDQSDNRNIFGKILEGGKVIDFSSVKASSRAENALAEARTRVQHHQLGSHDGTKVGSFAILGINEDVIEQVGHDLGVFATEDEIQGCASYLISKAPANLLQLTSESRQKELRNEEVQRYTEILEKAYIESGEVTSAFAKTFFMGTMLLGEKERKAIWAVYVWCRRTDEIVDAPRDNNDDMLSDLSSWEMRLEDLWTSGKVTDVYDLCLLDVRITYPDAEIQPYLDMIRGMLMDVPDLGQDRYDTFDELHLYCYRVAGTVGLMSLPVFGCANGFDYDVSR
jgi:15-cis-phytoene synthase